MKNLLMAAVAVLLLWSAPALACGHYEQRYETVVVVPAHYERAYVAPYYLCGQCVRTGYYQTVYVPPVYGTRAIAVWVEDAPRYREPSGSSWYLTVRGWVGYR